MPCSTINERSYISRILNLLRNILLVLFLLRHTKKIYRRVRGQGILGAITQAYLLSKAYIFGIFLQSPFLHDKVQREVQETIGKLEKKLVKVPPTSERILKLPTTPWSEEKVRAEMTALDEMPHTRWEDGHVSGAVYHGGQNLAHLQAEAFERFSVANPIHPDVFPGVRKMEAEVVAMVLAMFNAPSEGAGVTTSGGTESILMACLGAREKARRERGIAEPEMIIPETAHAAFRKAGSYFGIHVHLVACPAPSYTADINQVSRLINSNTILLVGSAPSFPHGIIDDIQALSNLALRKNGRLPLHVDCCLGSFLIPFLQRAGFQTKPFDFTLQGVTSISCDTHKYGFAPKGNSTLLYRSAALRAFQYYVCADWSGGVYASPSMAGSRPGALIAGCWASLMVQGEQGYIDACHQIVGAAKRLENAIRQDPRLCQDLFVLGDPLVSVVAFSSQTLNIYNIADRMSAKGWHLNALQDPAALHVAVTLPIVPAMDRLVDDLAAVVEEHKREDREREAAGESASGPVHGDVAALYGVAGSLPNKSVVVQLATGFLDTLYKA